MAKRQFTGVDIMGQTPLLEQRTFGENNPLWLLWLAYNPDRTSGTYLVLSHDGSILRETIYSDGSMQVGIITPAQKLRKDKMVTKQ